MSEDTMMGTNEAYGRVKKMMGQSNTGRIEYPSGTNMRGSGGREHHADGDMVGRENHKDGGNVGGQKKNCNVGDVTAAPGHAGSMMKPHFGAPQQGREMGSRRNAIAQVHGENHKTGGMAGREAHGFGQSVGRMADKAAGRASRGVQSATKATSGAMRQAGNAMQKAGNTAGSAIQGAAKAAPGAMKSAGNAMKKAMPRPMYRRGGRAENHYDED